MVQINVFIYFFTGCITYLCFSDRLNQLLLLLFGISMSIKLLHEISEIMAQNNTNNKDEEVTSICRDSKILFTLRLTFPILLLFQFYSIIS